MKAVYHKENDGYRVVQRGSLYYVQSRIEPSTRGYDGWCDLGKPYDDAKSALQALYTRLPLAQKAA